MYVTNPQGTPQVVLPYGSPSVVFDQNNEIIQPALSAQQSYVTVPTSAQANPPQNVSTAPPAYSSVAQPASVVTGSGN